jgi:hypothetical protein
MTNNLLKWLIEVVALKFSNPNPLHKHYLCLFKFLPVLPFFNCLLHFCTCKLVLFLNIAEIWLIKQQLTDI